MTNLTVPQYPVLVPGVGPAPACGMIIGEAPGENERRQGVPFWPEGDSGRRLDEALDLAGATRDPFFVTNLFKGHVGTGNRNPRQGEIRDHRPLLIQEMIDVQPRAILLLGSVAVRDLLPAYSPLDCWVGKSVQIGSIRWFPCWHPANRDPTTRDQFKDAVKAFVDHCNGQT
jgi:uracil-DNA glycosylase